jgi:hypothetical protein
MRRATTSVITTGAGIGAIVVGLAVIDERVRGEIAALVTGRGAAGELAGVGERVQDLGLIALQAVRDQSIEHAPLTLFALVALVLFVLMFRT